MPWLGWTCGDCRYCRSGRENLCERARFTGCDIDGGFAEYAVADERFCFPLPDGYPRPQAAPLLCAGLIGYRALRMAGDARAARALRLRRRRAHPRPGRACTRAGACSRSRAPGDDDGAGVRARARRRVGGRLGRGRRPSRSTRRSSSRPSARSCPLALRARRAAAGPSSARGIHMSDIPSFPYELPLGRAHAALGGQPHPRATARSSSRSRRRCRSARTSRPTRSTRANDALDDLRARAATGAAVVVP